MGNSKTASVLAVLACLGGVSAHSWVEAMYRISADGAFEKPVGYPLGYVSRSTPGFSDDSVLNKITDTTTNPAVCGHLSQGKYKRLQAAPGDHVALQYQENGHVTQPDLTPRPYRGGNVYIYGTSDKAQEKDGINDVLNSWDATGKGGNGKGQLLASHYYDDGQCYQEGASTEIYNERHSKYGAPALYCQSDFQVPKDLPTSGTYTVMWVWDWPLITDPKNPVTEIYTSCAEIELVEPRGKSVDAQQVKVADSVPVTGRAIPSQLSTLIEATALGYGSKSPDPVNIPTATAQPTTTQDGGNDESSQPPTSTPTPSGGNGGCDGGNDDGNSDQDGDGDAVTVTVTADAVTTTTWRTVTVDATGNNQGSAAAVPTTTIPMHSFKPRVTGWARRSASWYP